MRRESSNSSWQPFPMGTPIPANTIQWLSVQTRKWATIWSPTATWRPTERSNSGPVLTSGQPINRTKSSKNHLIQYKPRSPTGLWCAGGGQTDTGLSMERTGICSTNITFWWHTEILNLMSVSRLITRGDNHHPNKLIWQLPVLFTPLNPQSFWSDFTVNTISLTIYYFVFK